MEATVNKKYTEEEIKKILEAHLGSSFRNTGERAKVLSAVVSYVGNLSDAISLAELIPSLNAYLNSTRGVSVFAGHLGFFSILLFPAGALVSIVNAYQTGHRYYAYRAVAYTVTAWAFDQAIPTGSSKILSNIQTGFPIQSPAVVAEYKAAWGSASSLTTASLKEEVASGALPKRYLQLLFRAVAGGDPAKLCESILRGYEAKLPHAERPIWRHLYSIRFPQ